MLIHRKNKRRGILRREELHYFNERCTLSTKGHSIKDDYCDQLSMNALISMVKQSMTYLYLVSSGEYLALALNITWRKKNMKDYFEDMQNFTV